MFHVLLCAIVASTPLGLETREKYICICLQSITRSICLLPIGLLTFARCLHGAACSHAQYLHGLLTVRGRLRCVSKCLPKGGRGIFLSQRRRITKLLLLLKFALQVYAQGKKPHCPEASRRLSSARKYIDSLRDRLASSGRELTLEYCGGALNQVKAEDV